MCSEENIDVLDDLTATRSTIPIQFYFGEDKSLYVFDSVAFCPLEIGVTKNVGDTLDDYLDKIIDQYLKIAEQKAKEQIHEI